MQQEDGKGGKFFGVFRSERSATLRRTLALLIDSGIRSEPTKIRFLELPDFL
jgi:hypothetical protein